MSRQMLRLVEQKKIVAEETRQNSHIELIASENCVSKAVMAAMGSPLTNKYAEGDSKSRLVNFAPLAITSVPK